MTKTFLLTAASAAVVLFAGAAQAGVITGTVNAVGATSAAPYQIASERTAPTVAAPDSGAFIVTNTLTSPITVSGGSVQNYLVTFTVTGGSVLPASAATLGVVGAANGGSATVANAARTANSLSFVVTVTGVGVTGYVVNGFSLTTTAQSTGQTNIAAGNTVSLLAGGVEVPVDTAANTTLVRYAPVIGAFSTTARTAVAALPSFSLFKNAGTAPKTNASGSDFRTAELASAYTVAANAGTFHTGLGGVTVTRDDIINGATVTVTGPSVVTALAPSLTGITPTSTTVAANAAVFVLDNTNADTFSAGTSGFTLTENATPASRVPLVAGSYTTSWTPIYATNYTAPTSAASVASGSVTLDGVNFVAPWVSGTGLATSVIRLGNNATSVSGPVTVRLLNAVNVVGGVSTPVTSSVVYAAGTVPAGSDLQITSAQLVAAFGAFTRGDFQVTIQSDSSQLSAKLRNTRDGQTFEQSLGAGL